MLSGNTLFRTIAEELSIAIIGTGSQGRNLLTKCLKIPGVRFAAVCDIWPYHQKYSANILKKFDQIVNVYEDYHESLLLAVERARAGNFDDDGPQAHDPDIRFRALLAWAAAQPETPRATWRAWRRGEFQLSPEQASA